MAPRCSPRRHFLASELRIVVRGSAAARLLFPDPGVNRRGPALLSSLGPPVALHPTDVESAVASGATLVDGRSRVEFAGSHVPGSLNVELDEQFASYVGWLVPWNAPLVFVLPDPAGEALVEIPIDVLLKAARAYE